MRLRALPLLIALTAADYALWVWSIASGHDVVSLVAGLTLLPLAALSMGGLAVAGARLLRALVGVASSRARTHAHTRTRESPQMEQHQHPKTAEQSATSDRLAA